MRAKPHPSQQKSKGNLLRKRGGQQEEGHVQRKKGEGGKIANSEPLKREQGGKTIRSQGVLGDLRPKKKSKRNSRGGPNGKTAKEKS